MKLRMNDRQKRLLKIVWLPIVLLALLAIEPYLGIANTPYMWAYIGLQALLFVAYTYILYKDRPKLMPGKKLKGRRKPKK